MEAQHRVDDGDSVLERRIKDLEDIVKRQETQVATRIFDHEPRVDEDNPSPNLTMASFTQQYISLSQSPTESSNRIQIDKPGKDSSAKTPLPSAADIQRLTSVFFANRWPNYPILMKHDFKTRILASSSLNDKFFVYLVLAIAAIDIQAPEGMVYYTTAVTHYMEAMLASDPFTTLQGLMLLAIYAMSDPRGYNLWPLTGIIIRGCVDLGLHRNESSGGWQSELQRRVFWSAFALDRSVSIGLGRPVSIAVEKISTPLPLPVDDPSDPTASQLAVPDIAAFIHTCELRAINGMISTALYRPAGSVTFPQYAGQPTMGLEQAEGFREETAKKLNTWLATAPSYPLPPTSTYKTPEWFQIAHAHSLLVLYRPTSLYSSLSPCAMQICADASMKLIAAYSRLYTFARVTYTWVALHSLFMATLTTHFVLQNSPALRRSTSHDIVEINMKGCSRIFAAMSTQWPSAKNCQQICENMTTQTLSMFENDANESRLAAQEAMLAASSISHTPDAALDWSFPDVQLDLWAWLGQMEGQASDTSGTEMLPDIDTIDTAADIHPENHDGLTAADLDNLLYTDPSFQDWLDLPF